MPVYAFTTFDDPSGSPGTTEAWGVNDMDQIVGSYLTATGSHGFLLSGGTYITLDEGSRQPYHACPPLPMTAPDKSSGHVFRAEISNDRIVSVLDLIVVGASCLLWCRQQWLL
jgi:hypothetical protein